jgi:hypothetical protein
MDYEAAWRIYLKSARPCAKGGLVVEGDLYFDSEEELRKYFDERMKEDVDKAHAFQQISTGYIPKFEFPANTNIRYCISDSFSPDKDTWVERMEAATKAWEDIANIRFSYLSQYDSSCTSATSGVDFAVMRDDALGGYCGRNKMTNWFSNSCPLGTLQIDTDQDPTFNGATPNVTETGVLRHELGHILGLRHEHPWRSVIDPLSSCTEAATYASLDLTGVQLGTLSYDQLSVMHYPFNDCDGYWLSDFTLTNADIYSTQELYGMHPAWLVPILSSL